MQTSFRLVSLLAGFALLFLMGSCDIESDKKVTTTDTTVALPKEPVADETSTTVDAQEAQEAVTAEATTNEEGTADSYVIPVPEEVKANIDVWAAGDGRVRCTIYGVGEDGNYLMICSECPPICDTNLDITRSILPEALMNVKSIKTDLKGKNMRTAKYEKQHPKGIRSFSIPVDAINELKQQGAAYIKAWPARSKGSKRYVVLTGFDKEGKMLAQNKYYRSWKLCPPVCD